VGDGVFGHYGQGSVTTEFGLGTASVVDTLEIRWPSGTVQAFQNILANQRLSIAEDLDPSGVEVDTPAGETLLRGCSPNPSHGSAEIEFRLPGPSPVTIRVLDITGRLVRVLAAGAVMVAGDHRLRWDGRNSAGESCASGIYHFAFEANGKRETQRMVLLR
jgi:flagellar hook assembly protein FlgD